MDESPSLNSPKRIKSLSKERATVSFSDHDDKASGFSVSEEHGAKPSEVYGFVVSISTVIITGLLTLLPMTCTYIISFMLYIKCATSRGCWLHTIIIFFIWAYLPEPWLHYVGITYYPSRYWALAVPAYALVTVLLAMAFYFGLNFMATPPSTSLNIMFDEYSREPSSFVPMEGDEQPIEPISDIGINKINDLMFGSAN
ncbi:PREDICTED: phosphatidylinositol N-acetylglucosaminyltransferase subunit P-like isoform X1 [Nelumbo nucifera]|uniref:Phosphatidylinositol N-acetylglucosaminyltransferase subunit P-like isoform X1 n=1 Tax=Nelumbo nucifera TaxID=4432 RepID=A0A1U7Z8X9_NELNU|nr:PREDICTED: phosphatidylinositol N-acetylglucosaminyltransferase subunit P-like isoform X1 [Nelumbo nucifera]XP_010244127.1 PREDICTED: phosphatidylinositol N-acetylglucosaminyltransferase subunit P-like isoform X1 [Nelumbo nucifera]XP_010244135.1 PREDICTED: phosphatidylinositol N-acetylglucosaminyltransferase subunit P-like isoform X1 [Nelumbo nucifera]XP_010244140.1 PREDICTED: phosphatidylinositol N-acetylglucosaminyltransferase subunit P-like isoform X1 [Nelumbo nucifera]XP_010244148.1 PRED